MVRVEGDAWGVSEFIPLFYHPKAGYWNDLPPSGSWGPSTRLIPNIVSTWDHFNFYYDRPFEAVATDYKEGYFERAWMSFRCGDEVIVMLQNGVPVAVIGHADGFPRVGEDLMRVKWNTGLQHQWSAIFRVCVGEMYCQSPGREEPVPGIPFCPGTPLGEDGAVVKLNQSSFKRSFTSARIWFREFFVAVGPIYYIVTVAGTFSYYPRLNIRAALYSKEWLDALPNPAIYEDYIYQNLVLSEHSNEGYWFAPPYPFSAPQDCFTDRLYWADYLCQITDILTVSHTQDGEPE